MTHAPVAQCRFSVPSDGSQAVAPEHGIANGAAAVITIGPVNVELAGCTQSTWNLHRFSRPRSGSMLARKFGEPAGGGVGPSTSEGRRLATDAGRSKHTNLGLARPPRRSPRFPAHVSAPVK